MSKHLKGKMGFVIEIGLPIVALVVFWLMVRAGQYTLAVYLLYIPIIAVVGIFGFAFAWAMYYSYKKIREEMKKR